MKDERLHFILEVSLIVLDIISLIIMRWSNLIIILIMCSKIIEQSLSFSLAIYSVYEFKAELSRNNLVGRINGE